MNYEFLVFSLNMGKKKKSGNYSEQKEQDLMKVSEPVILYGGGLTLNLDETKRYIYADYLNWFDDKRRELINGFIRIMSAPETKHAKVSNNFGVPPFICCNRMENTIAAELINTKAKFP